MGYSTNIIKYATAFAVFTTMVFINYDLGQNIDVIQFNSITIWCFIGIPSGYAAMALIDKLSTKVERNMSMMWLSYSALVMIDLWLVDWDLTQGIGAILFSPFEVTNIHGVNLLISLVFAFFLAAGAYMADRETKQ